MYEKEGVRPFSGANSYIIPNKNLKTLRFACIITKNFVTLQKFYITIP